MDNAEPGNQPLTGSVISGVAYKHRRNHNVPKEVASYLSTDIVDLGTFVRQWEVEGRRIGWLLGAGASASANIPTADHIVMDLLTRLYTDAHQLVRQNLSLTDASHLEQVRAYYDGQNGMPTLDDPSSYSVAFELALPDEGARRQHLKSLFTGRSPSYGQRILGSLISAGHADLLITTNFDDLIEQAAEAARTTLDDPSRSRLGTAALGNPSQANLALSDDDFPFLFKLHGDFREQRLKNLASELQEQDKMMRQAVLDASRRFGLAVIGYSGRDASVMEMLGKAIQTDGAFPAGLWWLGRDPRSALPAVNELFTAAKSAGVSAHFVEIQNFDETLAALGRHATFPQPLRDYVDSLNGRPRLIDSAIPRQERASFPVLRMNALPMLETPTAALRATVKGSTGRRDLQNQLHNARWRGATAFSGQHVLALGSVQALSEALDLSDTPVRCTIAPASADAPTLERALIYEALTRGLARRLPATSKIRDSGHRLTIRAENPQRPDSEEQAAARTLLADAYGEALTGTCPLKLGRGPDGQARVFAESIQLSLEWRFDQLWLLFVPHTWVSPPVRNSQGSNRQGDPASAWRKERWVNRRNETWAAIIDAWAKSLAPQERTTVSVLPSGLRATDLVGGQFVLGSLTAYSREAE